MKLTNRVALITGAVGGIGSAVCRELAAQGAALCLVDTASIASVATKLHLSGVKMIEVTADVISRDSIT